jgi:hypothetical protein
MVRKKGYEIYHGYKFKGKEFHDYAGSNGTGKPTFFSTKRKAQEKEKRIRKLFPNTTYVKIKKVVK